MVLRPISSKKLDPNGFSLGVQCSWYRHLKLLEKRSRLIRIESIYLCDCIWTVMCRLSSLWVFRGKRAALGSETRLCEFLIGVVLLFSANLRRA